MPCIEKVGSSNYSGCSRPEDVAMSRKVTIIVYHFVRDLRHSRYPEIKGLTVDYFKEQISYVKKYYSPIKMEDLIRNVKSDDVHLPPNPVLLTFDDGYVDHFTDVFPILDEEGIEGSFFPPAKAIMEIQVLDVNKIHFILASVQDKSGIVDFIFSMLDELKDEYPFQNKEYYVTKVPTTSRFDTKEVIFIKAMLQRELPERARKIIIDRLFTRYVTSDEKAFSRELYMSVDQIMCMRRNGMYIGSHGYDHYWLNTLTRKKQEREIDLSLEFLGQLGCKLENWVMCYPYGAYNDSLLSLLKNKGCRLGLSVNVGIADLETENPLTLSRLDTTELPKQRDAAPNEWTLQAIGR